MSQPNLAVAVDIDLTECNLTTLPKSMCGCPNEGCRGSKPKATIVHTFDRPVVQLLDVVRPIRGLAITWYPHEKGSARLLDDRAGHVHIALGFGRDALVRVLAECPNLYLVTAAPSWQRPLVRNLDLFEGTGIGVATMRTHLR